MADTGAEVAKEVVKCIIIDRLKKWYTYIKKYNDNMKRLQESHDRLKNHKETIVSQVERDKNNLRNPTKLTDGWLAEVRKIMTEDEECKQLLDKENIKGKDQCCFGRLHCNLYQRYEMSKTAEYKANKIEVLIKEKPNESNITEPIPRSELKAVPNEFLKSLESRVKLKKGILDRLRDDQVNVVGVYGMGAIGKTTLVKEIANSGAKDMFDKVVMVEISEVPNVERIQGQIAEQIGLSLGNVQSLHQRAEKLYTSIKSEGGLANKRYKILIILDNIWEKLDLSKVGIPQPNENSENFLCNLLLTSRKKDVCEVMRASLIFEVHTLDEKEARQLFRARVGEKGQAEGVENRMLKKCGGLPLSIVALADVLRDQELSMWEHYATELEKPISSPSMIRGVNRPTYSILEKSYKLLESEEKRRFLLLACLFPFGASISSVGDMMRYGIGIGLFQYVNNLIEAMDQAKTWAYELKSSSLLLENDTSSLPPVDNLAYVKIHDVVRASTILLAETGGQKFMVEAIPRWMREETLEKYTAISLMAGTDHSRLRGLKSDKLEILILDGTQPPEFDESFSQDMTNLKVLVLKGMEKCDYGSPNSIQESKSSLVTLHLENCKLGDIAGIGKLVFLEVLSLHQSTVEELPAEAMRNLCNLRLLDLTGCKIGTKGIPADVLARLSQLEGLYSTHSNIKWSIVHTSMEESSNGAEGGSTSSGDDIDVEIDGSEYNKYASVDELNKLRYLNVLEMQVRLEELPNDVDEFVNNLDQFRVQIVSTSREKQAKSDYPMMSFFQKWRRFLVVCDLDMRRVMEKKSAKALLMKTEELYLACMEGLEHYLVPVQDLDGELPRFEYGVKDIKIRGSRMNEKAVESGITWSAFPNLESLYMVRVNIVRMAVGYQQPKGRGNISSTSGNDDNRMLMLPPKLRLILQDLRELEGYVVPIDLLTPIHLEVRDCPELKYIFGEAKSEAYNNNNMTSLKSLELHDLPQVESMVEVPNSSTSTASPTPLFNTQLTFGAPENVRLEWMDSKEIAVPSYSNLKILLISRCMTLESLCPLSIAAALVHLKTLDIGACEIMREAIRDEDGLLLLESSDGGISNGTQLHSSSLLLFPSLESLGLGSCPKMERFISSSPMQSYNNNNNILPRVIEFPSLHTLEIRRCNEMQSFSAGRGSFRAPKLTHFKYDNVQQSMQDVGYDIDHFLETRYRERLSERTNRSEVQH